MNAKSAAAVTTPGRARHPRYLHHEGKPVLSVWGFGFTDRGGNAIAALAFIKSLQAGGYFVIGGIPTYLLR